MKAVTGEMAASMGLLDAPKLLQVSLSRRNDYMASISLNILGYCTRPTNPAGGSDTD